MEQPFVKLPSGHTLEKLRVLVQKQKWQRLWVSVSLRFTTASETPKKTITSTYYE